MGGLTRAVHWWEEWQLRVLVLTSMSIQVLLLVSSVLRRYAIPRWSRYIIWLTYLSSDAVAIYALATLFNRHNEVDQDRGGGRSIVELLWAPVLLIHLGGYDSITAYNIEDNELWSRHMLTAVFQVTVAIYVFKKSWPGGVRGNFLSGEASSLFIAGVLKCFIKPWALKRASIYSLVGLAPAKQKQDEMYSLQEYVTQAKAKCKTLQETKTTEAAFVREQNSGEAEAQIAKCHKEPGIYDIKELMINIITELLEAMSESVLLGCFVRRLYLSKDDEEARPPTQGSFCGRIRERLTKRKRLRDEQSKQREEMLQRSREANSEAWKLLVDLSSPYSRRLSILQHFCGLTEEKAYGSVRKGLAAAFLLLYTKVKTTSYIDTDIVKVSPLRSLLDLRLALPLTSLIIFHESQSFEVTRLRNDVDVKITYAILYGTVVLEFISLMWMAVSLPNNPLRDARMAADLGKKNSLWYAPVAAIQWMNSKRDAWPQMVGQYSLIGYFARRKRHRSWMWVASLLQCRDFLDQHWCMESCSSSETITKLVLRYLKHGWMETILQDDLVASYHRFNDHTSRWVLQRNQCRSQVPFDECVLLWHIATDFCFFFSSSFSISERISASAEVPAKTILTRITEINRIQRGGRRREMVSKVLTEVTSSSVDNDGQIKSECRQMSNYMVYLLFVNPEMLLPGTRRNLFTAAYDDLRDILGEENKSAAAYNKIKDILTDKKENVYRRVRTAMKELIEILRNSNRNPIGWSQWKPVPVKKENIMKGIISTMLNKSKNKASEKQLKKGCEEESKEERLIQDNFIDDAWALAQGLLEFGHELGDDKMWEVIQGVWVEMLCYSASRCRGYLHAKALGNGGEFLSYVWLLLFHMGMETFTDKLKREQEPPSHEDTTELKREQEPPSHEDSMETLQREHLPCHGGNQYGTASTSTHEICEVPDHVP